MVLSDDGAALTVLDQGRPVLTYRYGPVDPPSGVDNRYRRAFYIHPLYGLDGEVLTQDFLRPLHHRGVSGPGLKASGDRVFNLGSSNRKAKPAQDNISRSGCGERPSRRGPNSRSRTSGGSTTTLHPKSVRSLSSEFTPAEGDMRSIDVRLDFKNVCKEGVTLLGLRKGYGFLYPPRLQTETAALLFSVGGQAGDTPELESAWADVSSRIRPDGTSSGVALFQHPSNPGFPHPGWIFRAYGFLGASWPHLDPCTISPGENVELRYRLLVHRGTGKEAEVDKFFAEYLAQ
jgi:hypothetical protein